MNAGRQLPERIEADGLLIRRWQPDDADVMEQLLIESLEHLTPWMAWAANEPLTPDRRLRLFKAWDRYWLAGGGAVYGVFEEGTLIGGCALHRRGGPDALDLGYWLGSSHTGRGHATRIAQALTHAACADDNTGTALISHEASNRASGSVAERLGYESLGTSLHGTTSVRSWRYLCAT